jgi:hypothetical protein
MVRRCPSVDRSKARTKSFVESMAVREGSRAAVKMACRPRTVSLPLRKVNAPRPPPAARPQIPDQHERRAARKDRAIMYGPAARSKMAFEIDERESCNNVFGL